MKKQRINDLKDNKRLQIYYEIMLKICNSKSQKVLKTLFEKMRDIEDTLKIDFKKLKAILNEILLEVGSVSITPQQLLAILENEDLIKDGSRLIDEIKTKAEKIIEEQRRKKLAGE